MLPFINQPCLRHPSIIQLFKQLCHFFELFPLIPALGGNIFSDRYLTVGGEVSKMQSSDKFQYIMCLLLGDFCAPGYFIDDAKLWCPDSLTFADINIHSHTAGVFKNLWDFVSWNNFKTLIERFYLLKICKYIVCFFTSAVQLFV